MQRIYEISIEFCFVFRGYRPFAKLTPSSFKFNFNVISRADLRITKLPDRIEYLSIRIDHTLCIILFRFSNITRDKLHLQNDADYV